MHTLLSIVIIILCLFLFFKKKHKALSFIFILSLFNRDFEFNIGVAMNVYHFITILYIPRILYYYTRHSLLKKLTRPLVWELVIIFIFGVLYGFVFPFDDPFATYRGFTQQASMRAIISFIKMLLEFYSILMVVYWLSQKYIDLRTLFKYFSIVVISSVVIAFITKVSPGVFTILFPKFQVAFDGFRFRGLAGESRTFGRICGFSLIFLLYYNKFVSRKLHTTAVLLSSLGVILSMSASALIVSAIGLSMFFVWRKNFSAFFVVLLFVSIGYVYLSNDPFFQDTTLVKIKSVVAIEQEIEIPKLIDEPDIFTRFEIFDRSALNFFYNNPQYLIFGVGPNLISIPASQYIPPNFNVYSDGINSVPTTLLINILSRSGLVGLILQLLFAMIVYTSIVGKSEKQCFITTFIMSFITANTIFILIQGVSVAVILLPKRKMK